MTENETLAIMGILKTSYPHYYKGLTRAEAESAIALWSEMFADDSAEVVAAAVKSFIATDTKGFPPVIGVIKKSIVDMARGREKSEYEAWGEVKKALNNANYGSVQEFEKLSPDIKRVVGSHMQLKEWAAADLDDLNTVIASNFQRSYRAVTEASRKEVSIGGTLGALIGELSAKMQLPQEEPPKQEQKALPISVEAQLNVMRGDIRPAHILPERKPYTPMSDEELAKRKALLLMQIESISKKNDLPIAEGQ